MARSSLSDIRAIKQYGYEVISNTHVLAYMRTLSQLRTHLALFPWTQYEGQVPFGIS